MIRIVGLSKKYEGETSYVFKNVNLLLPDVGLIYINGKSGSGKTTLASIIGCMDDDYEGSIYYDSLKYKNMDNDEKSKFRLDHVSFCFQGGFMDGRNKVKDELIKSMCGMKESDKKKMDLIKRYLRKFELSGYENYKIDELSGGERKRISLIKAIIRDSDVLIVDEPTAGLNPKLAKKTMGMLKEASNQSLVLLITHDRIDIDNNIIELNDGIVTFKKKDEPEKIISRQTKNKKINHFSLLVQSIHTFFRHIKSSAPATFATTISLTCFGIALSLVGGVRNGFVGMGASTFDTKSVIVEPNSNRNISGKNVLGDMELIEEIAESYSDYVKGYGAEYYLNLNDKTESISHLYLNINENYTYPQDFGMDVLAHPLWRKSCSQTKIKGMDQYDLEYDEVFIGFPSNGIAYLFTSFPGMYEFLEQGKVKLEGNLSVSGVSGTRSFELTVRGFYPSSSYSLMHTSPLFAQNLLEDVIGFDSSYNLSSLDVKPHTLKKGGILYIEKNNLTSFYRLFMENKSYSFYALEKYPSSLLIKTGIDEEYIKVAVREKKYSEVNSYDINEIVSLNGYGIDSYVFSSSVYTFVQGGMYSGFSLPVFLSDERSKLIELSDMNATTDKNLGMFQISQAQIPDGVIGADLNSSLNGKGIGFVNIKNSSLDESLYPKDDNHIAISSSLAKKIYGTIDCVKERLCLLLLGDIVSNGDGYNNIFYDCDLTVSGVIESEEDNLYHDAFFPQALAFKVTEKSGIDLTIDSAILKFETDIGLETKLAKLRKLYPDYDFYCPFTEMAQQMDEILGKVSTGLCIFASVSLVLSTFLMFLTSYLVIKEDERGIGDYLSLGFSPNQVKTIYISYVLIIGLMSFLQSSFTIFLGNIAIGKELTNVFGTSVMSGSYLPYLVTFILCVGVCLIVSLIVTFKVKRIDPRTGFRL